jgi:hypothetical protein
MKNLLRSARSLAAKKFSPFREFCLSRSLRLARPKTFKFTSKNTLSTQIPPFVARFKTYTKKMCTARRLEPSPGETRPLQRFNISTSQRSLPLNRPGRFAGDVKNASVHSLNLVDDPAREFLQQVIRQFHPVRGHAVL